MYNANTDNEGQILLPGRTAKELVLTVAGNLVKHLGVQMYAGRPVPAIAELISNSWDADATVVDVRLPLDERWDPANDSQFITVSDDGNGMTWDMVRDAYLNVGRDRRKTEGRDRSPAGRRLQGRKGVGKLAGFGIADTLEVQTIHQADDPDLEKRVLIWIRLDLSDITKIESGPAPVRVVFAGPVSEAPPEARKSKGTTVTLRHLHERQARSSDRFQGSMARRFLLLNNFQVRINGQDLQDDLVTFQLRMPDDGWTADKVQGCGPVDYWIGFTEHPRQQNQGESNGVLIYTRGKVSQEETFFDISGGVTGQHGLRYLVGKVRAEWLDAGIDSPDHIATPRDAIAWESPEGTALREWGQRLLRKCLSEWANFRSSLREQEVRKIDPEVQSRIENLAPAYKDAALRFVEKFKSVEMEPSEFKDIISWFLDALENATLRRIFQRLRDTDVADLQQLDDLLSKMEVRIAVTLLQIIEGNLAAIDTLERMHHEDAKERGLIAKHLERNPWLIDPTWMLNKAEARVATWIKNEFSLNRKRQAGDDDRVDFFCVSVGGTLHIVEIKRGAHIATTNDILQADKYRDYVQGRFQELTEPNAIKYSHVQAHLIASKLHGDAQRLKQSYSDNGWVFFTTWDDLIERAKLSHNQFREALQLRAIETNDG